MGFDFDVEGRVTGCTTHPSIYDDTHGGAAARRCASRRCGRTRRPSPSKPRSPLRPPRPGKEGRRSPFFPVALLLFLWLRSLAFVLVLLSSIVCCVSCWASQFYKKQKEEWATRTY